MLIQVNGVYRKSLADSRKFPAPKPPPSLVSRLGWYWMLRNVGSPFQYDLSVEQPKKFDFIVNLKAAKQIGLTIPPNVLARADRVIK